MSASYPGTLPTFTTKTNKVDLVDAAHINDLQLEVVALATELGTDPAGSCTDLKTRLAVALSAAGAFANGTAFPTDPAPIDGQPFFRTDESRLYVYNDGEWRFSTQQFFALQISRVLNASSGDVAYTGVGFKPKAILFYTFATVSAVNNIGVGVDDGTRHKWNGVDSDGAYQDASNSLRAIKSGIGGQTGYIKTFDDDGFTITWAKSGDAGSGSLYAVCLVLG